jgi:hypothetical protein
MTEPVVGRSKAEPAHGEEDGKENEFGSAETTGNQAYRQSHNYCVWRELVTYGGCEYKQSEHDEKREGDPAAVDRIGVATGESNASEAGPRIPKSPPDLYDASAESSL